MRTIALDPTDPDSEVDPFRIKLARTLAEATDPLGELPRFKDFAATAVDAAADTITRTGHGFAEGQSVTYRAEAVSVFFTEGVDVTLVDRDIDGQSVKDIDRTDDGVGRIFDSENNIFLSGHGFSNGDAVVYRNTGGGPGIVGLTSGNTYFVIVVNANEIRLASTYYQAVGRALDTRGNDNPDDDILAISVTRIPLAQVAATYTTASGTQTLVPGNTVRLGDTYGNGGAKGGVYEYVGLGESLNLGTQDYTTAKWRRTNALSSSHSLERSIEGLQHGVTYYVKLIDANTFQLKATRDTTTAIQIDEETHVSVFQRNGEFVETRHFLTRSGTHHVGTEGIDLRPAAARSRCA